MSALRWVRRAARRADAAAYALSLGRAPWTPPAPPDTPRLVRALGLTLHVPVGVLDPVAFRTGVFLARLAAVGPAGARLWDVGTGSGVVALHAARRGLLALASDLEPAAVRAARVNACLNRLEVEVRQGDLFSALELGERFDLVAFNPPFFSSRGDGPLATALFDGPGLPTLDRFLAGVRDRLRPGGRILLASSSTAARGDVRALYRRHGFSVTRTHARELLVERLLVEELHP